MKRSIAAAVVVAVVLGCVSLVGSAAAHRGHGHGHGHRVIDARLFGSHPLPPNGDGVTLFGVAPGGLPWVIAASRAKARRDGRIEVRLRGLLIPGVGVGPVRTITASLFCNGSPVGETAAVPLSPAGDARIRDTIPPPPHPCLVPAILVHPNGAEGLYIAATGA